MMKFLIVITLISPHRETRKTHACNYYIFKFFPVISMLGEIKTFFYFKIKEVLKFKDLKSKIKFLI